MDYVAITDRAGDGSSSACVLDLLDCVACGETEREARPLIAEAVGLYVASLRRHGEPAGPPTSTAFVVRSA